MLRTLYGNIKQQLVSLENRPPKLSSKYLIGYKISADAANVCGLHRLCIWVLLPSTSKLLFFLRFDGVGKRSFRCMQTSRTSDQRRPSLQCLCRSSGKNGRVKDCRILQWMKQLWARSNQFKQIQSNTYLRCTPQIRTVRNGFLSLTAIYAATTTTICDKDWIQLHLSQSKPCYLYRYENPCFRNDSKRPYLARSQHLSLQWPASLDFLKGSQQHNNYPNKKAFQECQRCT